MICQSLPQDPFPRLRVAKMLYSWGSLCRLLNSIPKNEAQHNPISHTQVVSLFYILFLVFKMCLIDSLYVSAGPNVAHLAPNPHPSCLALRGTSAACEHKTSDSQRRRTGPSLFPNAEPKATHLTWGIFGQTTLANPIPNQSRVPPKLVLYKA